MSELDAIRFAISEAVEPVQQGIHDVKSRLYSLSSEMETFALNLDTHDKRIGTLERAKERHSDRLGLLGDTTKSADRESARSLSQHDLRIEALQAQVEETAGDVRKAVSTIAKLDAYIREHAAHEETVSESTAKGQRGIKWALAAIIPAVIAAGELARECGTHLKKQRTEQVK